MTIPPPRRPFARAVFEALDTQAKKRKTMSVDEWILAERLLVLRMVNAERVKLGKNLVNENDVLKEESMAQSHVDYMWKFSYGAEDLVNAP